MMKFLMMISLVALLATTAFGQGTPTLRIVTEDPNLPSDLYYGDLKVKPLRLRPGTNQRITIDDNDFMIQQHYVDFLARMPEPAGFQGWMNRLSTCPPSGQDSQGQFCDRIEVSSAFFRSPEYQGRRYWAYRFYSVAFHRLPKYLEFVPDAKRVSGFLTDAELEAARAAFANDFVARADFVAAYGSTTAPAAFVDALLSSAGVTLQAAARQQLINDLTAGTKTRAQVLRAITESTEVYDKYYNEAFVVNQYHGYLRRDPDILYLNWIDTMNRTGDYRTMINGFLNSVEYRDRF
ncbi:MAG TPA: hypothetical protein VJT71_10160 [Pyrinomonadaceae bacterium]|nr:hypothetical protein [Pyrinomonadaceae bacterium]